MLCFFFFLVHLHRFLSRWMLYRGFTARSIMQNREDLCLRNPSNGLSRVSLRMEGIHVYEKPSEMSGCMDVKAYCCVLLYEYDVLSLLLLSTSFIQCNVWQKVAQIKLMLKRSISNTLYNNLKLILMNIPQLDEHSWWSRGNLLFEHAVSYFSILLTQP